MDQWHFEKLSNRQNLFTGIGVYMGVNLRVKQKLGSVNIKLDLLIRHKCYNAYIPLSFLHYKFDKVKFRLNH